MGFHRSAAALGLALLAAACAGAPVHQARNLDPQGSDFDKALHASYLELAVNEWREGDYKDSDAFAERAIAAGSATAVEPESLEGRNLPAGETVELAAARAQLMDAFANGARERSPVAAARAQVMFDCWMQEQEENVQPRDIGACREGFIAAMADIAPAETTAAEMTRELKSRGAVQVYGIKFDFDSARLRDDSRPALNNVLNMLQANSDLSLRIIGHTDATGPDAYNLRLSHRRARSVVDWLIENGIATDRLQARGMGETEPVGDNANRQGRAANRRVELKAWAD